jgi:hypothetical protein
MRGLIRFKSTSLIGFTLLLLNTWGCLPATYDNMNKIRFTTIGKIPIIEGKINGKRALFIVDTGASCSILNQTGSVHFGFGYLTHAGQNVYGLGGNAKINQVVNCAVEFGPLKIRNLTFRTNPLDYLTEAIREHEKIEIAGIIGSDIFNRYGITIDFKHNLICFNR